MSLSSLHRFQNKRWVPVLQHIVLWLFILALPYLMQYNYGFRFRFLGSRHYFYMDIATKLIWVVVFYLNAYVFTPRYIYRKKYFRYGVLVVLMLVLIVLCNNLIMNQGGSVAITRPRTYVREDDNAHKGRLTRHYDIDIAPVAATERIPEEALPVAGVAVPAETATLTVADSGYSVAAPVIPALPSVTLGFLAAAVFNLAPYFLTLAASLAFRMIRDKTRNDALAQENNRKV